MIISAPKLQGFLLFVIFGLLLFTIKSIKLIHQYTFIIIILHVSTLQSINTPSLLILTIKHNITIYWLPIELGVILSIMCTMFSVCILMSWQNFTQKCMNASKVKDDLRCSFEKQIRLQFNNHWPCLLVLTDQVISLIHTQLHINYKTVNCIILILEHLLIINFLFKIFKECFRF